MNKVPKIIHQTWKTNDLTSPFKELSETWKYYLPDWEYILWTDEMNREFVAEHFPEFLTKYDSYPHNIQRADAIRYLLLKKYGGLYVDLDFECLENIEFLFDGAEFIAGKEPHWHAHRFGFNYIVCNAFMASTPNNDFINFVYHRMLTHPLTEANFPFDVLDSTGPFLLTHAYNAYPNKEIVHILEPKTIYPIGQWEVDKIKKNEIPGEMKKRIDEAHAIHYFFGTW